MNQRYFSQHESTNPKNSDANSAYKAKFENLRQKQGETPEDAANNTNNSAEPNNQTSESIVQEDGSLKMESVDAVKVKKTVEKHFKEAVSDSLLSKAFRYCREVYEETFPSENYDRKKSLKREQAKIQRMTAQETIEYTEEELEKVFSAYTANLFD